MSPERASLPAGWTWVPLGDLGRWQGGGTPSKANPRFWDGGKIPWVSPKDMKTPRIRDSADHITPEAVKGSAANLVPAGSVLVVTRSGILERTLPVAVTDADVTVNQDLKALTPREGVDCSYIAYALRAFERDILHGCSKSGTTVASIEFPSLKGFAVPLAPQAEQKRVVTEIEKQLTRLDAGVEALKRLQAHLRRYRAAVLKAASEGSLVQTEAALASAGGRTFEPAEDLVERLQVRSCARKRHGETESGIPPKTRLPNGWRWVRADRLSAMITDGEHITPRRSHDGVLLLSARNVLNGRLSLEQVDYIPEDEYRRIAKRFVIEPGDVLLSCSGSVGRSCVVPTGIRFALVRSVAILKPLEGMGRYLSLALRSPIVQDQIHRAKTQTAQANIFQGKIRALWVPLPPIQEQQRIVDAVEQQLSIADAADALVSQAMSRSNRLRASILKAAFDGRLIGDRGPSWVTE